ncbi:MAG: M23 family metallopeptidase [Paludibacteraceae bacterium]|nr:M23 family metallopeptidase [Paludibacteraceae bacterium]
MKKKKSFFNKIRFKYKLSILNENTLEEVWHIRLSMLSVFLSVFSVAVLYFFLIAMLISYTPLRGFVPGYIENATLRKQVLVDAVTVDSLLQEVDKHTAYVEMLRRVMSNEVVVDSASTIKSITEKEREHLNLDPSEKEFAFRSEFEESERTTNVHETVPKSSEYLMCTPVIGVVTAKFDPLVGRNGMTLVAEPKSSVYSVLDGVVTFSGFSSNGDYVLQVQHVDAMLSIYRIKQPFLKKVGDDIHAGEILATFLDASADFEVNFEIWKAGKPVNPATLLSFK